jgi:hypothetical protein
LRVSSGHYDLCTLEATTAMCPSTVAGESNIEVTIFKSTVTPSMKSGEYNVCIVFRTDTGEFMPSPISSCGCPHGTYFCSHMLGKLLLFSMIQHRPDLSFEAFKRHMPPPIRSPGNKCVPVTYHWRTADLQTQINA